MDKIKAGDIVRFCEFSDFCMEYGYSGHVGIIIRDITAEKYETEYVPKDVRLYEMMLKDNIIIVSSKDILLLEGEE